MSSVRNILGLAGWLVAVFAAAWFGARYIPGEWYAALNKPSWNPPNSVFAPVWTLLYVLMALAAWLVWCRGGFSGAKGALGLFIAQLVLNALWSYLFFGLHRPELAFLDIMVLWVTLAGVTALFWQQDWVAGAIMVPTVVWVSFAAFLNFFIWRLNVDGLIHS